jgi:hypothetical protein
MRRNAEIRECKQPFNFFLNFFTMKKKLIIFAFAMAIAGYVSAFCGYAECGGGGAKCCDDMTGSTYYCVIKAPE